MSKNKRKKHPLVTFGLLGLIVIILGVAVFVVKMVVSGGTPRKRRTPTIITLVKPPPPPPKIREKPPEVKPVKKDIIPQEKEEAPQQEENAGPDEPQGDQLGLDADGTAGGDAFGLVAKKGGKSILEGGGSGFGRLSLLTKFAGYIQRVESEIRKTVMKRLNEEGGIPGGKLQVIVRVSVDRNGKVVKYTIVGSSGNNRMDEAVKRSLSNVQISEPPPGAMPRTMVVKITSIG